MNKELADSFRDAYWASRVWESTRWLGYPVLKCPLDLFIYQELLWQRRPNLLVEVGTAAGGSALFFATILDAIGAGHVITVDCEKRYERPNHKRIQYLTGDSLSPEVLRTVESASRNSTVAVSLDGNHEIAHVRNELEEYSRFVSKGQFFVLEDTFSWPRANGDMNYTKVAADEFLVGRADFARIAAAEKFHATFNPGGWMERL